MSHDQQREFQPKVGDRVRCIPILGIDPGYCVIVDPKLTGPFEGAASIQSAAGDVHYWPLDSLEPAPSEHDTPATGPAQKENIHE